MIVAASSIARTRWANGSGWTRELLAWPVPSNWVVRVSVAEIECDGPFSEFRGVDRWFAVLEGAGVILRTGDQNPVTLTPDSPLYSFSGDVSTASSLIGGPVRDVNFMCRRNCGRLAIRDAATVRQVESRAVWLGLFTVESCTIRYRGERYDLAARALAWFDSPDGATCALELLTEVARGWWLELS